MVVIDRTGHPRKDSWWLYLCRSCKEVFWAPSNILPHECYDCSCDRELIGGSPFSPDRTADLLYHGHREEDEDAT